jgi:hypothetical protein
MFNREKVQAQLSEAQGKTTARTLDIDQVERLAELAESKAKDLPVWILKYVIFEYQETVANSYRYVPDATRAEFTFTQKGTVKNVTIERTNTRSQAYGGSIRRFVLDVGQMTAQEYGTDYYGNSLLINRLIAAYGFNHQGTMPV